MSPYDPYTEGSSVVATGIQEVNISKGIKRLHLEDSSSSQATKHEGTDQPCPGWFNHPWKSQNGSPCESFLLLAEDLSILTPIVTPNTPTTPKEYHFQIDSSAELCPTCKKPRLSNDGNCKPSSPSHHFALDECCGDFCPDTKMPKDYFRPKQNLRRRSSLCLEPWCVDCKAQDTEEEHHGKQERVRKHRHEAIYQRDNRDVKEFARVSQVCEICVEDKSEVENKV